MSKDKITVKMVEQKYRAGIQAFARTLGDPTLRLNFMQEADPFFRRCALAVWKHGSPVTEKYVDTDRSDLSPEQRKKIHGAVLHFAAAVCRRG